MTNSDRKFIEAFKEDVSECKAMNIGIGLYLKDGERLLSIIESLQAANTRLAENLAICIQQNETEVLKDAPEPDPQLVEHILESVMERVDLITELKVRIKELETQIRDRSEFGVK